jgi:hypothetical protein
VLCAGQVSGAWDEVLYTGIFPLPPRHLCLLHPRRPLSLSPLRPPLYLSLLSAD